MAGLAGVLLMSWGDWRALAQFPTLGNAWGSMLTVIVPSVIAALGCWLLTARLHRHS
jgi:hypothetical protein